MEFRDRRGLKETARRALDGASWDPNKLILLYTGATALVMLGVTVLNYVLQLQIEGTGGLSGLGTRSVLETAAQVLQLAVNLVVPFWTMGYLYSILQILRGNPVGPGSMLEGFRHFGPVLRLNLYRTVLYMAIGFACFYIGLQIYMLTPLAQPLLELLEPYAMATTEVVVDDATLAAIEQAMIPAFVVILAVFAVLAAPTFYGLRLADYALLDDPKAGAMMAVRRSRAMMRRNRFAMAKLDLSFWWFYVLDLLLTALCYGDTVLAWLGVELPMSADTAYFVFYIAYLAVQVVVYYLVKNKVECTYAAGYEVLRQDFERQMAALREQPQQ